MSTWKIVTIKIDVVFDYELGKLISSLVRCQALNAGHIFIRNILIVFIIHACQFLSFIDRIRDCHILLFISFKQISIFKNILELQMAEKLVKSLARNGKSHEEPQVQWYAQEYLSFLIVTIAKLGEDQFGKMVLVTG